jgi:hypothetical protein
MARQLIIARYRGGYQGDHALQRGKVKVWREGEDLRLQALGGCFWFLFLRKFTIPAADVQRVEAVPARVRGSDVHVYTRNNGVLSLGFPNHQAPQARALVEALVANGARTPGGAG